jgi:recombination protein RecA
MTKPSQAAHVVRGAMPRLQSPVAARFCLAELAGRFVELSGEGASAVLTLAIGLVLDAQRQGEPVAWVTSDSSSFYPPDVEESGVDLAALVVIRARASSGARAHAQLAVAAERLLRSGAFGLVVIDLGKDVSLAQPLQTRLLGLAQRHQSVLLCLTEKHEEAPSLGSLVSLRAQARRKWLGRDRFECELHVLKDKRRGPTWSQSEVCRGPLGLR